MPLPALQELPFRHRCVLARGGVAIADCPAGELPRPPQVYGA
jgi:hypothetical protein